MRDDALMRYVESGHKTVNGWLNPTAIHAVVTLSSAQRRHGIGGSVSEIGVHHGRLFILLHLLTEPPELSVAWDLFEHQDENVDTSGRGDRAVLLRNLARHCCDESRIRLVAGNSLTLDRARILDAGGGPVRLFSVDGGHTTGTTFNDLALAEQTLCDGGLVILDDFFNPSWPGVAEGTCQWMARPGAALVPVAIAGNKFIFTNNRERASAYAASLSAASEAYLQRRSRVFGHDVLILTRYAKTWRGVVAGTRAWRRIKDQPIGRGLSRYFGKGF